MKVNINISLHLICVGILLPLLCMATNPPDTAKNIKVKIDEESFIIINGKTNVNKFQCRYDELSPGKTLTLNLFLNDGCMMFENAALHLATDKFDCSNRLMNQDFKNLLKADEYPSIDIDIQCITTGDNEYKPFVVKNASKIATVNTAFKIAGVENEYQVPVEIHENGKKRIYTGDIILNIKDFGLEPPKKMMGMVVVEETIHIQFYLVVALVNS